VRRGPDFFHNVTGVLIPTLNRAELLMLLADETGEVIGILKGENCLGKSDEI
jgi:hypothetical protein